MKILGKTDGGFITELSETEVALLCGKFFTYSGVVTKKQEEKRVKNLSSGDEIESERTISACGRVLKFEANRKSLGSNVSKMREALTEFLKVIDGKEDA